MIYRYIEFEDWTIELLTLIYRANVKRDKQEVLQEARERIEVIRLFIRLMKDMFDDNMFSKVFLNKILYNAEYYIGN